MMQKTVLVTGAKGFLGRFVADHYLAAGWRVVGLGHDNAKPRRCAGRHGRDAGRGAQDQGTATGRLLEWHTGDVDLVTLQALGVRPELLVHCAGGGSVSASIADPFGDYARTVGSTAAVLEFVRRSSPDTVVVYPSSAAVYGNAAHCPVTERGVALPHPASPYGSHKLMAEQLCASYAEHFGMAVAVIRFFSIYGEGLRKQLLWDACRKIGRGDDLFFGSGDESRDWLHAEDAARLIAAVAAHAGPACPIFNGASGTPTTVRDALALLYRELAPRREPRFSCEPRPGDPHDLRADIGHTLTTGWVPEVRLTQGIRRYARWFQGSCND